MADITYQQARKLGLKEVKLKSARDEDPFLPALEDNDLPFMEEAPLPEGYRVGDIVI